jgi:rubredoxin
MQNCTYMYDPDRGDERGKIPKRTPFEELPDSWKCPICKASKSSFNLLSGPGTGFPVG